MDFYFAQKTFFPKNLLPNSGCGLSTGAAYTRVNTVYSFDAAISDDITSMSTDLIVLYEIFSIAICGPGTLMW